jgi:outer membrane murein-binding lipoprotein Lpp
MNGSNGKDRSAPAAMPDLPTTEGGENLGAVVWNRVLRSSRVYMRFADFWIEFLRDVPGLRDHRNPRAVFGRWAKLYSGLFEQVVGSPPPPAPAPTRPLSNLLGPWVDAATAWSGGWPALSTTAGTGGPGRSGAGGLWGEVLNETLGMLVPGAGERSGRANVARTGEAYLRLNRALTPLYGLFYSAGVEALREFLAQVGEAGIEALAARPLRDVYRMWWTANENAFLRMFALPDFGAAMNEVLAGSLDLKQRTDDMAAGWCRQASLPTRADFDELAAAVQELRRTVRRQAHEIESLRAEAAAARRRGRTA